jgi:PAS domain S-box-containing protein
MRHLHRAGLQRYEETNQRHISWDGVELPGLHKDGHEVPLEISFSEFVRRGKRYFTGIARDITERKRAAAEKEQSEGRYRALSDAMPQLVWATDADGSHFYYNQRWYEYTGLTEEESMGFGFANALHPEDKERTLQCWRRAWRDGEAYEIEYRFYSRPRDEYRWFLGRATPVRDAAGKITQWVGTCTDIEEQKHMETSLARINRERTQMLEEVSTPVVPVWRGVLVMPLIGSLDTERMNRAMQAALGEVTRTGARACIIDITGARIVDSHAIANLSNLVSSLKLIGAEAIVTGVTAQVAKSLVKLGVDFTGMRTSRTLAQALSRWIKANGLTTDTTQNRVSSNGTGTESR